MRYVVLYTETTGLNVEDGHRLIEIGCLEIIDRFFSGSKYNQKINPNREVDESAQKVHGMSLKDLENSPQFGEIADSFCEFIKGSTLIIHNAAFDIGFLNKELLLVGKPSIDNFVLETIDTLKLARSVYPGKRNSLDALCARFGIDNSARKFHGAMLDASLLGDVYLCMTRGQDCMNFDSKTKKSSTEVNYGENGDGRSLAVRRANQLEKKMHLEYLRNMEREGLNPMFKTIDEEWQK